MVGVLKENYGFVLSGGLSKCIIVLNIVLEGYDLLFGLRVLL